MTIHAHAARERRGRLSPWQYEPGPLGPHEVEIAVSHCGICHSDVHLVDDDWGISSYPLVPGHEIVGTVSALGSAVAGLAAGQRVGVGWQRGACLECGACQSGHENLCARQEATCVGHHGGFADSVRVDARFAFPLPDGLDSAAAAPLLCGGATVYAPLRRHARPHMRVGVIGVGGLGHLALRFARAMGCHVTAFSTSPGKEHEARAFGAHAFVATGASEALAGRARSLDFLLSTVFAPLDAPALLETLRPFGTLCLVGATAEPISFPAMAVMSGQLQVTGSVIAGRADLREMLEFAARHGIGAQVELRPLAEADAALEHVRRGRARYRVVLASGERRRPSTRNRLDSVRRAL